MIEYVLGFRFDNDNVLLIQKNKPDWQKGKVNGIGGKIEPGENPDDAMVREFMEETGIHTNPCDWELMSIDEGTNHIMWVYRSFGNINGFESLTDEVVIIAKINDLPKNMLEHAKVLANRLSK